MLVSYIKKVSMSYSPIINDCVMDLLNVLQPGRSLAALGMLRVHVF